MGAHPDVGDDVAPNMNRYGRIHIADSRSGVSDQE